MANVRFCMGLRESERGTESTHCLCQIASSTGGTRPLCEFRQTHGGRGDPIWGQRTNISASRSCVGYSPGASIAHGKLTLADGGSDQALWRWVGSDAAGHERARQPNSSLASQSSLPDFPLASDQKLSRFMLILTPDLSNGLFRGVLVHTSSPEDIGIGLSALSENLQVLASADAAVTFPGAIAFAIHLTTGFCDKQFSPSIVRPSVVNDLACLLPATHFLVFPAGNASHVCNSIRLSLEGTFGSGKLIRPRSEPGLLRVLSETFRSRELFFLADAV
ncbi:uncharacterized protein BO96DRAFT_339198 [Aspergillus niger CBS 101883]|uniref:Contig An18c0030, genomic contig n=3 Tax=Aspergillus niger TaxID=5061 RepID=A2R9Y4_ASPNC|nr:uncharacterized protein BO96DRAFT_339198 [Aspergillus niger CBS 101883]XP_059602878.1 uncharacterized protein An18g00650 [Aspergillus niger]PYH55781.1 hypothetical protein BO96DRAFT_339198 [Aspergillus niger CBS 101883]RDH14447.1 hypothetical protein M747DRAFT_249515 [Aspergillus niger ATCC 13496]CAK43140.1 unnamed protein product [Aspergillus niger]